MNKRILLFLDSSLKRQEEVKGILEECLEESLGERYREVDIQTFYDISESINEKKKVGLGGEIFVMLDQREPRETKNLYTEGIETLFNMTKKACEDGRIPFWTYSGEIGRHKKSELIYQIKNRLPEILFKLNEKTKKSTNTLEDDVGIPKEE